MNDLNPYKSPPTPPDASTRGPFNPFRWLALVLVAGAIAFLLLQAWMLSAKWN